MNRAFVVALTAVSAGGNCVDKRPDNDCSRQDWTETQCLGFKKNNDNICEWVGGHCMDKRHDDCSRNPWTETECNGFHACEWVGGQCLDKQKNEPCSRNPWTETQCNGWDVCEWMLFSEKESCEDTVKDYVDKHGNTCAHYANNIENCKHADAREPGSQGSTPCQACCACQGCPEPTCGDYSCPQGFASKAKDTSCGVHGDTCNNAICCETATTNAANDDNNDATADDNNDSTADDNNDSTADVSISNGIHGTAVVAAFVAVFG